MPGIPGKVDEFIGIIFEIVKELGIVIDVANVFMSGSTNTFVSGDTVPNGEVLVEGLLAPVFGNFAIDDGLEAPAVIALGCFDSGPVEKGRGKVDIESRCRGNFPLLAFGNARVGNDEGHLNGFLIVGPLSGKATVGHVVAIVGGINDDGVIGEAGFLKGF